MLKGFLGWVARRALLFALLLAALVVHQLLWPQVRDYASMEREVVALERAAEALVAEIEAAKARPVQLAAAVQRGSRDALDARIRAVEQSKPDCSGDVAAGLKGGAAGFLANRRACIARALAEREIAALTALRDTADLRLAGETLPQAVSRQSEMMRAAAASNRRTRAEIAMIDAAWLGATRHATRRAALVQQSEKEVAQYRAAQARGNALLRANGAWRASEKAALDRLTAIGSELNAFVKSHRADYEATTIAQAESWAREVGLWPKAKAAAIALLGIMAMPYLIRILFFFVIAPLAARTRMIRLSAGRGPTPTGGPSGTSAAIRLEAGEELLVRQDYLQSTARGGDTRTRWLLDWRHPIASFAARLMFLTRIRGEGQVTVVSAVRDPFAEVAVLTLPEGAAVMLHPRALAAVAQPVTQPVRITRHWRLGTLNAWLTLQLRYFVFHGPCRLVVKGGRGVRIEPATRGRVFAQDQLVGFSADLAYAVTRTETFWPYFFGRESLLKDTVAEGGGVLVIEEAPLAGGGTARVRHGLEGATDALLKVFGI